MQRLKNQTLTGKNLLLTLPSRFAKQLQPEQGITGKQTILNNFKMKKLSLEKMEQSLGGSMPYIDGCALYAWATVEMNGLAPGSVERTIIFQIAYNQCWAQ